MSNIPGASENYFVNGSFESGSERCFNRMRQNSYLVGSDWTLDTAVFAHGKQSLRGENGTMLHLSGECMENLPDSRNPWVLSCFLRADRPDTRVIVDLVLYSNFFPVHIKRGFTVGTDWQRCVMVIGGNPMRGQRRIGTLTGPFELYVKIPKKVQVWIDAIQFEPGKEPTPYRESASNGPLPVKSFTLRPPLPPPETPSEVDAAKHGRIRLLAWNPSDAPVKNASVSLGVPLPAGEAGCNTRFKLLTADGRELPVQTEFLASRVTDGSAIGIGIDFEADLKPGRNEFFLEYGSKIQASAVLSQPAARLTDSPDQLWEAVTDADDKPLLGPGTITAVGLTGRRYRMKVNSTVQEKTGPIHRIVRKDGLLQAPSAPNMVLLAFEARIHQWRNRRGVDVEVTLFNPSSRTPVTLREIGWRAELPQPAGRSVAAQYGDYATRSFTAKGTRGNDASVTIRFNGLICRAELFDARTMHPSKVMASGKRLSCLIWSRELAPLLFSPGLAVTRRSGFNFSVDGDSAAAPTPQITACADAAWLERSGIPFALGAPGRTPFIDAYLDNPDSVRHTRNNIAKHFWFGLFDYGDHTGDGGWNNLESYEDYTTLLRGAHYANFELLQAGCASVRHYRDVDINHVNDLAIMHSGNHVIGGFHFGHAWTQGVMLHYLLTGDRRSREIALRNQVAIRKIPVDSREIDGDRRLGYWLLTISDGIKMLGCRENVERFSQQIDYMEKALQRPPNKADTQMQRTSRLRENTVFYWANSGLVPFANLYGCESLLAMRPLLGKRLDPIIRREVETMADLELTYRVHLEETWPQLPPEKTLPLIACDYIGGRGSYFYPVLANYSAFTGDPKWKRLAILTAYARILEGNTLNSEADILMTAALNHLPDDFDEKAIVAEVKHLLMDSADTALVNGDFSITRDYAEMMTPRRPDARRADWLPKNRPYPRFWRIHNTKEYTATEFMRYRPELYRLFPGGIELIFNQNKWYAHDIQLYSSAVRGTPGKWHFKCEFKTENLKNAQVAISASNFQSVRQTVKVSLRGETAGKIAAAGNARGGMLNLETKLGTPDENGFTRLDISFDLPGEAVLRVTLNGALDMPKHASGRLAFRRVECKPVK